MTVLGLNNNTKVNYLENYLEIKNFLASFWYLCYSLSRALFFFGSVLMIAQTFSTFR